ncbi:MAG TPA: universal stress protein [Gammaproteobacteria bacterium]
MKRFKKLLFVADGNDGERQALGRAAELAEANGATLTLFDAVSSDNFVPSDPTLEPLLDDIREAHLQARLEELEELAAALRPEHASLELAVVARSGNTARAAIRAVVTDGYDLVVKAPEGGSQRFNMLFGSTDQHLMRKCPCPVWIIRPRDDHRFSKILAAVEIDPNEAAAGPLATQIMEMSTSLAEMDDAELLVAHAWHLAAEAKLKTGHIDMGLVERIIADMGATHRKSVEALVAAHPYAKTTIHVIKGEAGHVIADLADEQQVDLVIIGSVGRSGVPGLMIGNTAEKVIASVDCSVLTIKPPGFETPLRF